MNIPSAIFFALALAATLASDCPSKKINSKLLCYYSKLTHADSCKCSHVVLPAHSDVKSIDRLREHLKGVKILITVNEFNQGLVNILKSSKVDGIEVNLKKLDSKNDINDFISTVRSKLGSDLYIVLSVPSKAETLAKFYDFKTLSKNADLFVLQTGFLGASKNVTFHPSRLSGLWDMQNTDSVVDLVSGLGAPLSKLVITSPVQAFKFRLQSEKHTAPGSPALEVQSLTRDELCRTMGNGGNWTLERDQDQAGPYIFSKDQWIAFDDATSIDIKAKYARVRGLAGMALKDLSQDGGIKCESSVLEAAFNGLSRQARAPRAAVLHSLEREILETPVRPLDTIQVSPYRISRVIDTAGSVHVIRQDTRTEFECSRQGYFVHPRSCGRFYRCVKFDQLSDEFSVFEFDCPAGLAFDSRVEVCVWPGSLPHASPCSGSSEIAPVPRERFVCPQEPGYYADPENCRWFFACLDHGKSPLSAYEFRCPFGLVYDESRLLCEWPWLVPKCGSGYAVGSYTVYGGSGSFALEQYDGLGVLGATTLGGLHGPLQQPVAKVYSNVGLISQGQNYVAGGNGRLSLKAAESLQNAGLLRTGHLQNVNLHASGLAYANGNAGKVGLNVGQIDGAGLVYTSGQDASLNAVQHDGGFGVRTQQSGLAYTDGVDSALNTAYRGSGYDSNSQGFIQGVAVNSGLSNTHNAAGSLLNAGAYQGHIDSKLQQNFVDHGLNLNYQVGSSGAASKSAEGYGANLHLINGGASSIGSGQVGNIALIGTRSRQGYTTNAHLVNGLADNSQYHQQSGAVLINDNIAQGASSSGYDGAKSTIEYHGNTGSSYGSGTSGNINIVGGGYSAVGVANSGVAVTNYGEDSNTITHVTQTPISVSTVSSIPTVTSVPVPALKVASGFQSYRGGVVANIPELQYKVQTDIAASRGHTGFANISNSFVNLVSSTPSTLIAQDGYHYPKPTVSFIEEPVKATLSTDTTFVQQNLARIQPVVTTYQKPIFVSTTQAPQVNVQPVVTTYQQPISTSFVQHVGRVQPVVTTYQKPVVVSTTHAPLYEEHVNVQPVVTTYQKPISFSTTQTPVVVQKVNIQPAVATYNVQKQDASFVGYDYPKPVVQFEEAPARINSGSFSYQNLDLIQKNNNYLYSKEVPLQSVKQAAVSSFAYSTPSTVRPVTLVEHVQPVIQVQPTVQTVAQPIVKQQPAISFTNFQRHENVQPQLQVTSYNVPSSTFKPIIVEETPQVYVSSTPAPVHTVVKQQPTVSFVNFQKHQSVQPQLEISSYNVPSSTIRPIVNQVVQQKTVQPAVVSSFSISSNSGGYNYDKPSIAFEEKASIVTYQQPAVQKTVITNQPVISTYNYQQPAISTYNYKNVVESVANQGYSYPKPAVAFEETPVLVSRINYEQRPAVVSSYSYVAPSTVKPIAVVQNQAAVINSYAYNTPSTVKPVVHVQQPVVSTYISSVTPKPQVLVQKQPAVVSSYSYTAPSTYRPAVAEPVFTYTPKPVVLKQQPAVVSSFSFGSQFSGYDYPKPAVPFVEQPAPVVTYENRQPVKEVPFVAKKAYVTGGQSTSYQYAQQFNNVAKEQRPLVVENYQAPVQVVSSTPLYEYQQPIVAQKNVVVSTTPRYEYEQPIAVQKNVVVSTTPRYEYQQEYSADAGYIYNKPAVSFEESPVVVENYQAAVTKNTGTSGSYYVNNSPRITQKVVTSTSRPFLDYTYVQSTPRPTFSSTIGTVVAAKQQPFAYYDTRHSSTVRPVTYSTSLPVVETVSTSRPISRFSFSSFDDQYQQVAPVNVQVPTRDYLPAKVEVTPSVVTTGRPVSKTSFSSLDSSVDDYVEPINVPTRDYLPAKVVTTSRPIAKFSFSSLDSQYQQNSNLGQVVENYVAPFDVTTPSRDYLPVRVTTSAPTEAYVVPEEIPISNYGIKVTTGTPITLPEVTSTRYVPVRTRVRVTTNAPEVTPSREYLPVRSRVRVTTTPSSVYLPVDNEYDLVSTRRPQVLRVSRPKTIVKVNDFHPLLSAKLGAQCTCVTNSGKLRSKPLRIVVNDEDDDGYVVDNNDGYAVDNNNGYPVDNNGGYVQNNNDDSVVVENYQYEPQKTVEITPTPEVYVKSTTSEIIEPTPVPVYTSRRRVRVRPLTSTVLYDSPVTEAAEIFLRKTVTPAVQLVNGPTDGAILNAVANDVKLAKQAAREGAKVALQSKSFDRYGPGGVRSRNEKLQGTIDCQRAGLFRHPNQCNKFYACRWDCTKNRYTLHVFNCPVHLTFDNNLGACNWPSQGPACLENTLLPSD